MRSKSSRHPRARQQNVIYPAAGILAAGNIAPAFTLRVTPDQNLTLSDLRGKPDARHRRYARLADVQRSR
jgi:hypothetical protein